MVNIRMKKQRDVRLTYHTKLSEYKKDIEIGHQILFDKMITIVLLPLLHHISKKV